MIVYVSTCRAVSKATGEQILQPGSFVLQAPIYDPEKLICIGMNYVDHCTEQNIPVPKEPVIFSKFSSAITEPNGPVLLSDETQVCMTAIQRALQLPEWYTYMYLYIFVVFGF